MPEPSDRSEVRRAILRQWMYDNDRAPAWVARRIGYTREYVANVLGGRYRFTDKLVRSCAEQLGIDFGYVGLDDDEGV
jgi:hypothetical protein